MQRREHRDRATAHRPMLASRGRRALSNVGGGIECVGDAAVGEALAHALRVDPGERDATLTHPFHAYPARMHPEIARRLVAYATRDRARAHRVLDPCCGSGTVLVEAMVARCVARGTDLSPFAVELARLKTRLTDAASRREMVELAHRVAREAAVLVRSRQRLFVPRGEDQWFDPGALRDVAALSACVKAQPNGFMRDALRMLLSSVLVKVSRQRSDSDETRVSKRAGAPGALHLFARKSLELSRGLDALARAVSARAPEADVRVDDASRLDSVESASVDTIITSPPYANTYDYVAHHARRYAWLGLDAAMFTAREIGAARWFEVPDAGVLRFAREMTQMLTAMRRVLCAKGTAYILIGDGTAGGEPLFADELIRRIARDVGFVSLAGASQVRPVFDAASQRAFRRRPKREHLIALQQAPQPTVRDTTHNPR